MFSDKSRSCLIDIFNNKKSLVRIGAVRYEYIFSFSEIVNLNGIKNKYLKHSPGEIWALRVFKSKYGSQSGLNIFSFLFSVYRQRLVFVAFGLKCRNLSKTFSSTGGDCDGEWVPAKVKVCFLIAKWQEILFCFLRFSYSFLYVGLIFETNVEGFVTEERAETGTWPIKVF